MKKTMSAAALALRLTAGPAIAVMAVTAGIQTALFWLCRSMWYDVGDWNSLMFEQVLDGEGIALVGRLGFVGLFCVMIWLCGTTRYRHRLLRVGENSLTALWALVFAGWFLIMWGLQLGLMLVFYGVFASATEMGPMALFLASYRSVWLHTLLPLAENWGYVRNAEVCLGWGVIASLVARYMRHGGKPWMLAVLVIVTGWMLPSDMATMDKDIAMLVLLAALVIWQVSAVAGGEADED